MLPKLPTLDEIRNNKNAIKGEYNNMVMHFAPVTLVRQAQARYAEHDLLFGQGFGCDSLLDDPKEALAY